MLISLSSNFIRLAGIVCVRAGALDKAIMMVRRIPGWDKAIKEVWPDVIKRLRGEKVVEAGPKGLLISALVVLLTAMNIDAQDASKPDTLKKVIETISEDKAIVPEDIKEVSRLIPFLITKFDRKLMASPFSFLPAFKKIFEDKVENGLSQIEKDIEKKWPGLSKENYAKLVSEGLIEKVNQPEYAEIKEELQNFLKKNQSDMNLIKELAYRTTLKHFSKI